MEVIAMFEHQEAVCNLDLSRELKKEDGDPRGIQRKREPVGLYCAGFLGWIDSTEVTSRLRLGSKKAFASCGRVRKTVTMPRRIMVDDSI
jgi:hypothetical protein